MSAYKIQFSNGRWNSCPSSKLNFQSRAITAATATYITNAKSLHGDTVQLIRIYANKRIEMFRSRLNQKYFTACYVVQVNSNLKLHNF